MVKQPGKKEFIIYFLMYSIPLLLVSGALSYIIYKQTAHSSFAVMKNNELQILQFQKQIINESIGNLVNDVKYLEGLSDTHTYILSGFSKHGDMGTTYSALLKRRKVYSSVRIIDSHGYERCRLNYRKGKVFHIQKNALQYKGGRYYFTDIMNTSPEDTYFSQFDFNHENGAVEIPYNPVLRVARLIIDKRGIKRGFVILNYNGENILSLMKSTSLYSYGKIFLLNCEGHLVSLEESLSREKKGILLFLRSAQGKIYLEKPVNQLRIASGFLTYRRVRISSETLSPYWNLFSFVNNDTLHKSIIAASRKGLFVFWIVFILSVILSVILAWSKLNRMKALLVIRERARIFDYNPAPVIKVAMDGEVVSSNTAAKRILGMDVIPRYISHVFDNLDNEKVKRILFEETYTFVYSAGDRKYYFTTRKDTESQHIFFYGMDITERSFIREELEKFRIAVQQSANDIVFTDLDGRIIFVNDAFEKITGYTAEDVLGKTPRMLQSGVHTDDFYEKLWETISHGRVWKGEFYNKRKDGSFFWEKATITPILDEEGSPRFYIAVKEDITEKKKIEEDLELQTAYAERARAEAESANRLKSSFLANMSHEIRTPLNAVLGFTQILLDRELNPGNREMVEIIQNSGKNLLELINDILDFSKIEADEIEIVKQEIKLFPFFDDLERLFLYQKEEKGLLFTVSLDESVPKRVIGDEKRIRQVLINIIGNAFKFTREGSISVEGTWKDNELVIRVSDTGIGIAEDALEEIFSPFKQSDASINRKFGGTGLGLAISQRLSRLMGGRLTVSSRIHEGSTFTLYLPLAVRDDPENDNFRGISGTPEAMIERWLDAAENEQIFGITKSAITLLPGYLQRMEEEIEKKNKDGIRAVAHECSGSFGSLGMDEIYKLMKKLDNGIREGSLDDDEITAIFLLFKEIVEKIPPAYLEGTSVEKSTVPVGYAGSVSILTAEDSEINRELIKQMLSLLSLDSDFVGNGYEVLEKLKKKSYDILLLDIQMPELDGLETIKRIRIHDEYKNLYVIAITANVMKGDAEKYIKSGCNDFIPKPIQKELFLRKIKERVKQTALFMPEKEFDECIALLEEAVKIYNPKRVKNIIKDLEKYPLNSEMTAVVKELHKSVDVFDSGALPPLIESLKRIRKAMK